MNSSRLTFRKKILYLAITVFIGTVSGLLLGEAVLRMAGPVWLRQLMVGTNLDGEIHYGSDAGWPVESRNGKFLKFKPLREFKVDYREYHTVIHTDQWGGRLIAGRKQFNYQTFIPVLGDSFAFGLGVNDEETFVSLLSQESDTSYLNLAAPGSSLPNDLDIIQFRHAELGSPPLYLIAFYLGNDFADMINYYESSDDQENRKNGNSSAGAVEFIQRIGLIRRSYIAQFISHSALSEDEKNRGKHKTRIYRAPRGQKLGNSLYLLMSSSRPYCSLAYKALQRSLNHLESLSKTLHFRASFIVIPDKFQTDNNLFIKQARFYHLPPSELDSSYPNHILEENLEKRGIVYFDVTSCLKDRPGLYYKTDDHLTAAGHRVVADCISLDSKWGALFEKVAESN